jgi:di/tricarboxylate transporter
MPDDLDRLVTFAIVAGSVLLFVLGRLRSDAVAVLSLLALFSVGVLSTSQALAGFADPTTVMVAALFVVGEGLSRTGVTGRLGQVLMDRAGASELRLLLVLSVGAAGLSAFMSNTGTVAMLMPAVAAAAWRIGSAPSRMLIPLAFAANVGGLITPIGSPPTSSSRTRSLPRATSGSASSSSRCSVCRSPRCSSSTWRCTAGAPCPCAMGE